MIRVSDSDAASQIATFVGAERIEDLARRAGMKRFSYGGEVAWGHSEITPRDQALFMLRLHRFIPSRHWAYARRVMSEITPEQRWGIAEVKPTGWELRFKGGWDDANGEVNHQVAFLERHGYRVAVAIFTEFSPSHEYASQTLRGVAKRLLRGLPRIAGYRGAEKWRLSFADP